MFCTKTLPFINTNYEPIRTLRFMRRFPQLFVALLLITSCASSGRNTLAIENVTVIDATGVPARPGMTVLIERDRITSVQPSNRGIPRNARRIDGSDKYLIPGLWDMHTHLSFYGEEILPMLVRHGV